MGWFEDNGFDVPGGGFAGGIGWELDPATGELTRNPGQLQMTPEAGGGDPNKQKLDAYRAAATAAGIPIDMTDSNVLSDPRFQSWQPGQPLPPTVADYSGNRGASNGVTSGAPNSIQPFGKTFNAPTMEEVKNSPGFQFPLGEGLKALERKASAGGTLNLPGTKKALAIFAEDLASKEYDKVYGRALNDYTTNRDTHQWDESQRFGSQRSNRLDDRSMFEADRGFAEGQRLNDFSIWHTGDTDQWNRTMSLADMGLRAGMGAGAAGQNYANSAGDLITGAGNAQAAGQVAGGNAYAGAFGDIANNAMTLAMLRRQQQPANAGAR